MLMELKEIHAGYGKKQALSGVSLGIPPDRLLAIVGPNGAGKTTTLRVISGQLHPFAGSLLYEGEEIGKNQAYENARQGISLVPQGGKVFRTLTVLENLEMGGFQLKGREQIQRSLEQVYGLFPILQERKKQLASTLSGGEQQMLAIGRGLMLSPKLLLLDEPSLGLAPLVLQGLMRAIAEVRAQVRNSIVVVEQNVNEVLKIANQVYGMKLGKIVFSEDQPEKLLSDEKLRRAYLS